MTEEQAICVSESMQPLDKLSHYMNFFVNCWPNKYRTLDEFISNERTRINDVGADDWKEKGFASKSWRVIDAGSLYWSVYHNIK